MSSVKLTQIDTALLLDAPSSVTSTLTTPPVGPMAAFPSTRFPAPFFAFSEMKVGVQSSAPFLNPELTSSVTSKVSSGPSPALANISSYTSLAAPSIRVVRTTALHLLAPLGASSATSSFEEKSQFNVKTTANASLVPSAVPTAAPIPSVAVTISVHSLVDGPANNEYCTTLPIGLPSCNLRSAWALCVHLISGLSSYCSYPPPSFTIVLPSGSTSILHDRNGGLLNFNASGALCNISVIITSNSFSRQATIQATGTGLLDISSNSTRAISLNLTGLVITGLLITDLGTSGHGLHLSGLDNVTVDRVTLLSNTAYPGYAFFEIVRSRLITFSNFLVEDNTGYIIHVKTTEYVIFTGCDFNTNIISELLDPGIVVIESVIHLSLTNTAFLGNLASRGSVLHVTKIKEIAISSCSFLNNFGFYSLAVQNGTDSLNLTDCSFVQNSAEHGGALYLYSASSSYMKNCSFINNHATSSGGAIYTGAKNLYIVDCSFTDNYSSALGGAIHIVSGSSDINIVETTLTRNTAQTDGGGIYYAASTQFISVISSTFTENAALNGSGAAMYFRESCSRINIVQTTLTRNTAQTDGGGIYYAASTQFISVISSTFTENAALNGSGGAMYFRATCSRIAIGGLQSLQLSAATANDRFGFVDMPNVSGYYVTFDEASILNDYINSNGIEISGIDGLAFRGGKYFSPDRIIGGNVARDDKSNYPGIGGNSPIFVNGPSLSYDMHENVGQFNFTAYPIPTRQQANVFSWNTASLSGGAIFWGNANTDIFVMPGTLFSENSVTARGGSGGAVFMEISNTLIHILSSNLINNSAYLGGAVSISQANYPMSFYDCNFKNNHAYGKGGAVYLGDGNGYGFFQVFTISAIRFLNSNFTGNKASSGGGVYISNSNAVSFNNTVMSGNRALSNDGDGGGAIYIESRNIVRLNDAELSQNYAVFGGAMKIGGINNVTFYGITNFTQNLAHHDGGAVSLTQGSEGSALAFLGETSFIRNHAFSGGGAIYSSGSTLILGKNSITFEGNMAYQGSAIRLEAMISPSIIILPSNSSITFNRNNCSEGTVSWVKDPKPTAGLYSAGAIPNFDRTQYRKNTATFGSNSSTQATNLLFAGKSVSRIYLYYSVVLPHPTVSLLDYSFNKGIADYSTLVTATVNQSFCHPHEGYLSGTPTVTASGGNAVFKKLTAYCNPGGNMTLKYTGK
jgi:predicted outer membrane repeat protein